MTTSLPALRNIRCEPFPGRSSQPSRRKRLIASVARIQIHIYTQFDAQASGLGQFVEQRLCFFEVLGVEALGNEP